MGAGGEIFILDMGKPVKIVDLARDLIRLSGFAEDEIRIEYSGIRPREEQVEELSTEEEAADTQRPIRPVMSPSTVDTLAILALHEEVYAALRGRVRFELDLERTRR